MAMGLSGIVLYAKDVPRLVDFYVAVSEMVIVERDRDYVVLSDGSSDMSIIAMPSQVAATIEISQPPVIREATPMKPAFRVRSLTAVAQVTRERGGGLKPLSAAWDFRGERHLDGFDPEGNVVQFVQTLGVDETH